MKRALAVVIVTALFTAGCGDRDDDPSRATNAPSKTRATTTTLPAPTIPPRPLAFERVTKTFVDTTRPTEDPYGALNAPSRTLATVVYIPDGDGPFPLIVHAHGADGHPRKFTQLASAWARRGYVVAVPAFPLTNDVASGGQQVLNDYVNQPADVSFVIDEVLRLSAANGNELSGKVDAERIGVSGLSLGGATTYGVVFNACCRDERVDATIIMSGIRLPFGEAPFERPGTPVMIMHGTADPLLRFESALEPYADVTPPKYFVTLIGAPHSQPYEDLPGPHDEVVIETTTDFWDAYLRDDDAAKARLLEDANVPALSSIRSDVREPREN
jgi:predicted dienelactone hydrolase